ncbi:UNKNOWN [Stylonychia lemnae]|uniref:Uncharacterized protein n=1 Tax=Stylonychia lemnae TaxID=5949 RepID=A0A078A1H3_STYLE|nr:UNKNOWN [Stylonychia lemnae]|eukprot:CDW75692.1 UNKNOWN [Stylonychia lemnae]
MKLTSKYEEFKRNRKHLSHRKVLQNENQTKSSFSLIKDVYAYQSYLPARNNFKYGLPIDVIQQDKQKSKQMHQTPTLSQKYNDSNNKIKITKGKRPLSSMVAKSTQNIRNDNTSNYVVNYNDYQQMSAGKSNIMSRGSNSKQRMQKIYEAYEQISLIDDYYKSLNNNDEIERIRFVNDYQRLMQIVNKIYSAASIFPQKEKIAVRKLLEKEVLQNQSQNPQILFRVNKYIIRVQKIIEIDQQLAALIEDRESNILKLKKISQSFTINEFIEKENGIQVLLNIRKYALRIHHLFKQYLSYINTEHQKYIGLLKCSKINTEQKCYMCKMRDLENEDLKRSSVLLMKLNVFISDFTLSIPKSQQEIFLDIQKMNQKKNYFTMNEVASFDKIADQLQVKEGSNIYRQMIKLREFQEVHHNSNYQSIQATDQKNLITQSGLGIANNFVIRFNWSFEDNDQVDKSISGLSPSHKLESKVSRNNLSQRAQSALNRLKQMMSRGNDKKFNTEPQHDQFESINQMKEEATYRECINIFQNQNNNEDVNLQKSDIKTDPKMKLEFLEDIENSRIGSIEPIDIDHNFKHISSNDHLQPTTNGKEQHRYQQIFNETSNTKTTYQIQNEGGKKSFQASHHNQNSGASTQLKQYNNQEQIIIQENQSIHTLQSESTYKHQLKKEIDDENKKVRHKLYNYQRNLMPKINSNSFQRPQTQQNTQQQVQNKRRSLLQNESRAMTAKNNPRQRLMSQIDQNAVDQIQSQNDDENIIQKQIKLYESIRNHRQISSEPHQTIKNNDSFKD